MICFTNLQVCQGSGNQLAYSLWLSSVKGKYARENVPFKQWRFVFNPRHECVKTSDVDVLSHCFFHCTTFKSLCVKRTQWQQLKAIFQQFNFKSISTMLTITLTTKKIFTKFLRYFVLVNKTDLTALRTNWQVLSVPHHKQMGVYTNRRKLV